MKNLKFLLLLLSVMFATLSCKKQQSLSQAAANGQNREHFVSWRCLGDGSMDGDGKFYQDTYCEWKEASNGASKSCEFTSNLKETKNSHNTNESLEAIAAKCKTSETCPDCTKNVADESLCRLTARLEKNNCLENGNQRKYYLALVIPRSLRKYCKYDNGQRERFVCTLDATTPEQNCEDIAKQASIQFRYKLSNQCKL